ncbi:MAG TPA: HAMP domain-containing sensor histidine kinase, partial [Candidatus Limnocylindrales bacterium]|nr:HAMP domain-containing sensor histidine kinase [Candidatus Limnocylindrales bacterium]
MSHPSHPPSRAVAAARSDASGLRIFLAIWFVVLGASITILPTGPLSRPDDLAWLRGLITAATGLALLWVAPLEATRWNTLTHAALAILQAGFAIRLIAQGMVAGGVTLLVMALAIAALPLYATGERRVAPRLPAYPLAATLSSTVAVNGLGILIGGDRLNVFLIAAGVPPSPWGLAMLAVGAAGAIAAATGRLGQRAVAVTTVLGAILLLTVVTMGSLRVSPSYWALNATVYVRVAGLALSAWAPQLVIDWRSALVRVTVTLATAAVVPLLLLATVLFHGPAWAADMETAGREALFGMVTALIVASAGLALVFGRQLTSPLRRIASVVTRSPKELGSRSMVTPITEVEDLRLAVADVYDQLAARNVELMRANATKDEFLGLVSHELKTPVTTILAGSALLAHGAGDHVRDLAADIETETQRLATIIDNLLALARVESGETSVVEPILLRRLATEIVEPFIRREPDREFHVDGQRNVIVEAAPEQLAMIVRNFVSNAVKYSPPGSPITVHVGTLDGEGIVTVHDVGESLSREEAERVFDAFYRTPVAEKTAHGVGIGLAVCRRIAVSLGGD